MHDTLDYFSTPFGERPNAYGKIVFSMHYFYNELYLLALSHDEVVHGKKTIIDKLWGTYAEKCAQLRTLYFYMYMHPGKKLNFMGNEKMCIRDRCRVCRCTPPVMRLKSASGVSLACWMKLSTS